MLAENYDDVLAREWLALLNKHRQQQGIDTVYVKVSSPFVECSFKGIIGNVKVLNCDFYNRPQLTVTKYQSKVAI